MIYLSTFFSSIGDFFKNNASSLIASACTIVSMLLIYFGFKLLLNRYKNKYKDKNKNIVILVNAITKGILYILIILTIIIILYAWGVNVVVILIGIAIILVTFLFGASKLIYDIINGMCIILGDYYKVDDVVNIEGFKGRVVEITPRITKLINNKNEVKVINNGRITSVINYSKAPTVIQLELEISKQEKIDKLITLLDEQFSVLKDSHKQIMEGPYISGLIGMTSDTYTIGIVVKTEPLKSLEVKRTILNIIKETFDKEKIKTPYSVKEVE